MHEYARTPSADTPGGQPPATPCGSTRSPRKESGGPGGCLYAGGAAGGCSPCKTRRTNTSEGRAKQDLVDIVDCVVSLLAQQCPHHQLPTTLLCRRLASVKHPACFCSCHQTSFNKCARLSGIYIYPCRHSPLDGIALHSHAPQPCHDVLLHIYIHTKHHHACHTLPNMVKTCRHLHAVALYTGLAGTGCGHAARGG
jgi:hypothetical protein